MTSISSNWLGLKIHPLYFDTFSLKSLLLIFPNSSPLRTGDFLRFGLFKSAVALKVSPSVVLIIGTLAKYDYCIQSRIETKTHSVSLRIERL